MTWRTIPTLALAVATSNLVASPVSAQRWYETRYSGTYDVECLENEPEGIYADDSVHDYGTFIELDSLVMNVGNEATLLARDEEIPLMCDVERGIRFDAEPVTSEENTQQLQSVYLDPGLLSRALPVLTHLLGIGATVDELDLGLDTESEALLATLDGADRAVLRCALIREEVLTRIDEQTVLSYEIGSPEHGLAWCQQAVVDLLEFVSAGIRVPHVVPTSYEQTWTYDFWEHLSGWSRGQQVNTYRDGSGDSHPRRLQVRSAAVGNAGAVGSSIMVDNRDAVSVSGPCAIRSGKAEHQHSRDEDGSLVQYGKSTRFANAACVLPLGPELVTLDFTVRFVNYTRAVRR